MAERFKEFWVDQMKIAALASAAILSVMTVTAHAEDWSKFYDCVAQHRDAVEQAEPSVLDGARLIVDVLCSHASTELGNQMLKEPSRQSLIKQKGVGGAFGDFLHIMRSEVTLTLFEARKARLGL